MKNKKHQKQMIHLKTKTTTKSSV